MRDSDWSRPNLLRSDWLPIHVATMTTLAFLFKGRTIPSRFGVPFTSIHMLQVKFYFRLVLTEPQQIDYKFPLFPSPNS